MDKDDDSSVGHASYVSSCAQSYGSFDETNVANKKYFTTYNEPTLRSYASMACQKVPPKPTVTKVQFQDKDCRMIKNLQVETASLKVQMAAIKCLLL
jgi:hypothetical protein